MTKKNIIALTVTILVVAGIYIYLYKDYFQKPGIHISYTIRPPGFSRRKPVNPSAEPADQINFGLGGDYRLTSVKVISVAELKTNQYAHPVWELTTQSNSAPVRVITYGMGIRGMHPVVKGATADPLAPNVPYRLYIEAGPLKGEHEFIVPDDSNMAQ